jgi:methanesulfonate monooxygenase large subunit
MSVAISKPHFPDEYLVDNRVYTDRETFELEQERLFLRTWNFVCHESEIENPGDYISTSVAGVPIIVSRNQRGELRAFYNTCRHRAAQVVCDERGNANTFTCFYHLWSYDLDGALIGAPEIEAYKTRYCPEGLRKEDASLVPVRVASMHRLVFVCFDEDTPGLADFLSPAFAEEMRYPFGDPRIKVEVVWKKILRANWKMAAENSRDGYHAPLLHKRMRGVSPPRPFHIYPGAHTIQHMSLDYEAGKHLGTLDGILAEDPGWADKFMAHPLPGLTRENPAKIMTLFPDLLFAVRFSTVLIMKQIPLSVDETLVEARRVFLSGDSDEIRDIRFKHWDLYWSPESGNVPEDWAAWESQQIGVKGLGSRYSIMSRGEDGDEGMRGDDNRIRAFWTDWRKYMGVHTNAPVAKNGAK